MGQVIGRIVSNPTVYWAWIIRQPIQIVTRVIANINGRWTWIFRTAIQRASRAPADDHELTDFKATIPSIRPTSTGSARYITVLGWSHWRGFLLQVVMESFTDHRMVHPSNSLQTECSRCGKHPECFRILDGLAARAEALCSTSPPLPTGAAADQQDIEGCRLYLDCIRFLREKYPSLATDPDHNDLHQTCVEALPECFGTLVNYMTDHTLWRVAPDHTRLATLSNACKQLEFTLSAGDSLGAIISALFASNAYHIFRWHTPRGEDAATTPCMLMAQLIAYLGKDADEHDHYNALFIDCIARLSDYERLDRAMTTFASPMPWSLISAQESAMLRARRMTAAPSTPPLRPTPTFLPLLSEEELSEIRWTFVSPVDILWLGAPHDGYSFCPSLSTYVAARRPTGSLSTFRRDAALWLGALSFGLLEAVVRMRIPEHFLLTRREQDGAAVIPGSRIVNLLNLWLLHCRRDKHSSTHIEHGKTVARLLLRAAEALDEALQPVGMISTSSILMRGGVPMEDCMEIIYGLAMLLSAIRAVVSKHRMVGWEDLPDIASFDHRLLRWDSLVLKSISKWYWRKLMEKGWCPYSASSMMSRLSPDKVFLLPTILQVQPYVSRTRDEHRHCSSNCCLLERVTDLQAYRPRHVQPSCKCQNVIPLLDDICRLLRENIVPIIVYDVSTIRVLPSDHRPYVAISHVWSQGMGGSSETGLPECMVQRIAGLARRLLPEHGGAFWIDSLCVPEASDERKRAIMLMAATYRNAAKVLVIEESIRKTCSTKRLWPENVVLMASSAWMRRVWTLQEGLLARELYMEFIEGPERICPATSERKAISNQLLVLFPLMFVESKTSKEARTALDETPLSQLVTLLQGRTTSKAEDELLAVADFLPSRVDLRMLLAIENGPHGLAEARMRSFLLQLREVPLRLPLGESPRLSAIPGFSWAPAALSNETQDTWSAERTGICTEDGLVAEYLCLTLEEPFASSRTGDSYSLIVRHTPSESVYAVDWMVQSTDHPTINAILFAENAGYPGGFEGRFHAVAVHTISGSVLGDKPADPEVGFTRGAEASRISLDAALHHFKYVSSPKFERMPLAVEKHVLGPSHRTDSTWDVLDVEELQRVGVRLV